MSGFPSRVIKSQLGSTLRDPRTVEHPEYEWGADYIELLKWQAIGSALCSPRAVVCAAWNTGTEEFDIFTQDEAWNPSRAQAHPALARTSAGIYTYTFAQLYDDQGGNHIALDVRGFRAVACPVLPTDADGPYAVTVTRDSTAGVPTLTVTITDSATDPADVPFWLEVL
jgi:hypothetical protein